MLSHPITDLSVSEYSPTLSIGMTFPVITAAAGCGEIGNRLADSKVQCNDGVAPGCVPRNLCIGAAAVINLIV